MCWSICCVQFYFVSTLENSFPMVTAYDRNCLLASSLLYHCVMASFSCVVREFSLCCMQWFVPQRCLFWFLNLCLISEVKFQLPVARHPFFSPQDCSLHQVFIYFAYLIMPRRWAKTLHVETQPWIRYTSKYFVISTDGCGWEYSEIILLIKSEKCISVLFMLIQSFPRMLM